MKYSIVILALMMEGTIPYEPTEKCIKEFEDFADWMRGATRLAVRKMDEYQIADWVTESKRRK